MIERHLASATLAMVLLYFTAQLWVAFIPVTYFTEAKNWQTTSDGISAEVSGLKLNACNVVSGSAIGWQKRENGWTQVPFYFFGETSPKRNHPAEWQVQSFGRLSWTVDDIRKPVRMTVQHDCSGTLRTTVIGPFTFEQ